MDDILQKIAAERRARIGELGHTLGVPVPERREHALVPFGRDPFVICEIKRKSPSRGNIDADLDPREQARRYVENGVRTISVLTEEGHFGGSLADLMQVKAAYPQVAVLRKDFLLDVEDIDISYRAGADAVLLIAALLSPELLSALHARARSLGMAALVEVHTEAEVDAIRALSPELVGVNSRDLTTFRVDRLLPVRLRPRIDWLCRTVFESGISDRQDVSLAVHAGYDGVLVGEAVVRRPQSVSEILDARQHPDETGAFWRRLFQPSTGPEGSAPLRPIIKICGLTQEADVRAADELGADLLGFILADSPRRADISFLRALPETRALKVGVVVLDGHAANLDPRIRDLLSDGFLDALQLHGEESPEACRALGLPYYKALRLADAGNAARIADYGSPRVLVDAFSSKAYGGTGKRLDEAIVAAAAQVAPLWLAGGLSADNVRAVVESFRPELVDASSRLESAPGKKDHTLLSRFFSEIEAARQSQRNNQ